MYEVFDGLKWIKVLIRKRKAGSSLCEGQRMISRGIQANPRDNVIVIDEGQRACIDANGELKVIKWE